MDRPLPWLRYVDADDVDDQMSDQEWKRFNEAICQACSITGVSEVYFATETYSAAWDRQDYRYPDWWQANPVQPNRMGESAVTAGVRTEPSHREGERITANEADPSPHFDGRAQPGDVIGLETGGERTYIGDTAEDENKRRRDAERAAQERSAEPRSKE